MSVPNSILLFHNKNQFTGVYMYNWKILSQVKKKNLVVVCRVALCLVTSEESKRVKASSLTFLALLPGTPLTCSLDFFKLNDQTCHVVTSNTTGFSWICGNTTIEHLLADAARSLTCCQAIMHKAHGLLIR